MRRSWKRGRGISNPRFSPLLAFVFDKARSEKNALAKRALLGSNPSLSAIPPSVVSAPQGGT